jgi:hypothetical protein
MATDTTVCAPNRRTTIRSIFFVCGNGRFDFDSKPMPPAQDPCYHTQCIMTPQSPGLCRGSGLVWGAGARLSGQGKFPASALLAIVDPFADRSEAESHYTATAARSEEDPQGHLEGSAGWRPCMCGVESRTSSERFCGSWVCEPNKRQGP